MRTLIGWISDEHRLLKQNICVILKKIAIILKIYITIQNSPQLFFGRNCNTNKIDLEILVPVGR